MAAFHSQMAAPFHHPYCRDTDLVVWNSQQSERAVETSCPCGVTVAYIVLCACFPHATVLASESLSYRKKKMCLIFPSV